LTRALPGGALHNLIQDHFDVSKERRFLVTAASKRLLLRLKNYFATGFIAILPLLLTVFVLNWIANAVTGYVGPQTAFGRMLQSIGYKLSPTSCLTLAYLIGIGLFVVMILVLGALLESGARKTMQGIAQRTVYQLPLVRAIYRTADKFINLMPSDDADNLKGMQVVYCSFGSGSNSAGTLALLPSAEAFPIAGQPHVIVLIPTAPIPIGGAMLFVPADSVFVTDMSIDAFAGSYMSMGVSTAQFNVGHAIGAVVGKPGSGGLAAPTQAVL
jgi:uncharacterized membrane protein